MSPDAFLPDDELLSSFLDGELTAEEGARLDTRLAREHALQARLDGLRQASWMASAPVTPLDIDDRDELIRAAVAAASPPVADLDAARARRHHRRQRVLTAAAAIAVVVLAVPLFQAIRSTGGGSDEATTAADSDTTEDATARDEFDALQATESMEDAGVDGDMHSDADAEAGSAMFDDVAGEASEDPQMMTSPDSDSAFAALGPNPTFDPLPDDLGPRSDLASARQTARAAWASPIGGPVAEESTDAPDDELPSAEDTARNRASGFLDGFGGCGDLIDQFADEGFAAPPVAVDYTQTTVAGEPFTLAIFLLADDSGLLVVIDTGTCTVIDREPLAAS